MRKTIYHSLTDPCKTSILLVPVGNIDPAVFQKYASLISKFNVISLSDITPYFGGNSSPSFGPHSTDKSRGNEQARFTTNLFKEGSIQFNFVTSVNGDFAFLEQFQLYRQVLGVIGIIHCQSCTDLTEEYQNFISILKQYPTCLISRCYAFEPSDNQADDTKGVIMIPNVGNISFYMNTMICDFASSMLNAFNLMAASIESSHIIHSPNSGDGQLNTPSATPNGAFSPMRNSLLSPSPSPSPNPDSPNTLVNSATSFADLTPDVRAKKCTQGRVYKLISDLYLMAGKLPDALALYTSAIETTRNNTDFVWHASALEGYYCALTLLASTQPTAESVASIPIPIFPSANPGANNVGSLARKSLFGEYVERSRNIIALYDKVDIACLQVESRLKGAKLLTIILKFGTGEAALNAVLEDQIETKPPSGTAAKSHVLKAELMNLLMQSWSIARDGLSPLNQVQIASIVVAMCSTINYHRKSAYFLRQCTLVAAPIVANVSSSSDSLKRAKFGLLEGMRRFCDVYGVDVDSTPVDEEAEVAESYGWPELQIDVIEDCIAISDGLTDSEQTINYTIQLLRKYHRVLSREEQLRLSFTLQRIVNNKTSPTNSTKAISRLPILKAFEVCRPVPARVSYPQHKLKITDTESNNPDPFIYNPYAKKTGENVAVPLVVNDLAFFDVTLVNPFAFDLDISSIRLSTEGIPFESVPSAVIVPSGASILLRLSGTPQAPGDLALRGCFIRLFGSNEEEFLLTQNREGKNEERWRIELDHLKRVKQSGLDSAVDRAEKRLSFKRTSAKFSECKFQTVPVIEEQPLLEVASSTLLNSSIMLFEGGKSHIDFVLRNVGTTPIDFIAFSFTDNTVISPPYNHRRSQDISAESLYEMEMGAQNEPVLSLEESDNIKVHLLPNQEHKVTVTTYGKRGCTTGDIIINYGYLEREEQESDLFYIRQLNIPVMITVNQGLSISDVELLPFQRIESLNPSDISISLASNEMMKREDIAAIESFVSSRSDKQFRNDYCLMVLDVLNVWMLPLKVNFAMNHSCVLSDQDPSVYNFNTVVNAGCTHRLILPVKRIFLSEELLDRPIPNLTKKQFTVPKGPKLTLDEERLQRALFWYKQEFLRHISATWVSGSFEHQGVLHFQGFRLTESMLEALKKEEISFRASLVGITPSKDVQKLDANRYCCKPNEICNVQLEIHNHQEIPAKLCLRVQPVHDHHNGRLDYELSSFLAFNGVTQTYLRKIPPNGSIKWSLPIAFFSPGEYKIMYHGQDVYTQHIYYATEPLVVQVHDG
ncbi:hypothetical protein K7432_000451 [Basidiobolus ranarum]|uniref:Uncharacterized protein n=1 Tax=Basidiobolus ranarum TaxID=34480 RepID=A0ABR2X4P1_9FUNG